MTKELRFRQVHLDFHTSPFIPEIGSKFDKKLWQERLQMAHVDSITCFSCCHHGYSYHPTKVGAMHPHLNFNLLREQIDASHEINVNVPIYLTAGLNNYIAEKEPGWLEISSKGELASWAKSPLEPGYRCLCFNSPYLDYLCRLTEEAARMFPDADGMFFDIIVQHQCCCPWCMKDMLAEGYNPESEEDRLRFDRRTVKKYLKKVTEAARSVNPDFPVFHNNSNLLAPGNRDLFEYYSHFELESLPTGGWGYDHYPLLAAYCRTQDKQFVGMTGKFHSSWGEFGGFKSANALRYECCAMLAQGSRCSVGDQLHPTGLLDESTYRLIGKAYKEVEEKENFCKNITSMAEVAIISNVGFHKPLRLDEQVEIGISRFLLESHIPFDRLDEEGDFSKYKVLILADDLRPDAALRSRLQKFLAAGGKVIVSGMAIFNKENDEAAFDLPMEIHGVSDQIPNYIAAPEKFAPQDINTPFVMYRPSVNIKVAGGESLGDIYEPYFVRSWRNFSSHRQTPNKPDASGYSAGILTENILYFAHPVFTLYAIYGNVILKNFIANAVKALLGKEIQLETNLPSQGRVTFFEQKDAGRFVFHALYATPSLRGMVTPMISYALRETRQVEVIDELTPVYNVNFKLKLPRTVTQVTLQPQNKDIPFESDGKFVKFSLEKIDCHQIVTLQ
ncbi:MAG: beta-galactosidase [Lentisphaerae bacterium]|nr:beta-galactosidase [Lentisphaerota bacterium]